MRPGLSMPFPATCKAGRRRTYRAEWFCTIKHTLRGSHRLGAQCATTRQAMNLCNSRQLVLDRERGGGDQHGSKQKRAHTERASTSIANYSCERCLIALCHRFEPRSAQHTCLCAGQLRAKPIRHGLNSHVMEEPRPLSRTRSHRCPRRGPSHRFLHSCMG